MRVTQSMMSSNMLRNLNTSYSKMSKYQNMLDSGKVITRPSDDPVVAVKGMGYRIDLDKNQQYQRNLREANTWLDTTDESLDQVGEALKRVKELIVQAANDTNTADDRQKINAEMQQIKEQLRDIANTKVGENYIFSGTHTNQPLYTDKTGPQNPAITTGGNKPIEINVFDGISMNINTQGADLFKNIDGFMTHVTTLLESGATGPEIGNALGLEVTNGANKIPGLDGIYENTLAVRADVGARQNRVEMMENRLSLQEVNVTKQLSANEDTDYAKTITDMVTQESIHQAALSVGAKIIQQTLVDFIR
ncbi:flagellar hook-associated protein FlgL [Lysinibacillus sp. CNPSo 3705]|uniref:flagellar hook-associated protein FlgL n=1 Tax=Lysinibacillus sp. CNPSo 3705 TaxID=3028148 RepID=UPI00236402A3|nr:flagellar hook-associated protein FlgL [Lysinibacillus sp. CNPSo 3705]MDD1503998.1 flagellar hook-associated protein FlgL [Lysinibacillus sp. CNPSo 3705]